MGDIRDEFKSAARIRCDVVDEVIPSPEKRTKEVLLAIGEARSKTGDFFTNWDLICFCCLYLASQLEVVPDLKQEVQTLAFKIHQAHYFSGQEFDLYDEDFINREVRFRRTKPESSESKNDSESQKQKG